jgi:UDP:flavonoid glycosyltransferase YjiC (YdhE family)
VKKSSLSLSHLYSFGDQDGNLNVVKTEGWGIKLDLNTLTEITLSDGIREVLYNPE